MRVLLADDHPMFLEGLRAALDDEVDIEVVGEAATGEQAIRKSEELRPDVVLMDINMPGINGIDATRSIRERLPATRVLILSMQEDEKSLLAALHAGATGYILKGARRAEIKRAVRSVAEGVAVFGEAIASKVLANFTQTQQRSRVGGLTERETEVIGLVAGGLDNASIARRLFLSSKTVKNHLNSIFSKLQVSSRAEAIVWARRMGLGDDNSQG